MKTGRATGTQWCAARYFFLARFLQTSQVVDPWGKIVAALGGAGEPDVATADIDLDALEKGRAAMPVMQHRRSAVYRLEEGAGGEATAHNPLDGNTNLGI